MLFEPQVGDSVTLVFSMRGLSRWKATHGMAAPDTEGMLSQQDAMVFPGLGPVGFHLPDIRITSDADGLTVQRADGERVRFNAAGGISVATAGTVTIEAATNVEITGTSAITITGGNVTITGTTTVNGVRIADQPAGTEHTHSRRAGQSHTHGPHGGIGVGHGNEGCAQPGH